MVIKTFQAVKQNGTYHQASATCPENVGRLIILPVIGFNGSKDSSPAKGKPKAVYESSASPRVFEPVGVCPGKYLGHAHSATGLAVHICDQGL